MIFKIVKKKGLTKFVLIGACVIGMALCVSGCGNKKTNSNNANMISDDVSHQMEKSQNNLDGWRIKK